MLIFYLTVTRNPAGVNQSIKAGLLTHVAGLHGIPFSFLNSMSTVFGNLNATKV